jgi:uncharacterized damage-inducible protein DinB
MSWGELLRREIESTYAATDGLMRMVDADKLDWKPETGQNWMTTGQLLMHLTDACGFCIKGLVTGDWTTPGGVDLENMSDEEMLPTAEKMPTVESVEQARKLLAADKQLALDMLARTSEEDLVGKDVTAPWDPTLKRLGHRLLDMVGHLNNHKGQLFYYLKLQGKPVHTGHYYGMG